MINVNINPNVYNEVFYPYIDDQTRMQIFFGGSGSGKSVFLAQRCICDILKGDRNYLIIRNVSNTIRTSVYNELHKVIVSWELQNLFKMNKTEMVITCINGFQILCKGLDDVEKTKSITSEKGVITDIWAEEATEISADDYKQLTKRLRGSSRVKKRIMFSFNPIMRTHWICKEYFKDFQDEDKHYRDEHLVIQKTTYKDNRFLEPDDIYELENEKNEYYYNVYTLGNWGVLGNLVFTNWRIEDLSDTLDKYGTYYNGLDFGFTNDPTAFGRCAKREKKIYLTHEIYEYGLTNDRIAELVKPVIRREPIRCDAAEPKSISELKGYGLNAIAAHKGQGSVNHGIQFIQQHEIIIHRELQNAINEFRVYQWQKNRDGEIMNVPVDRNNHYIDQLRYALSGISFRTETKYEPLTKEILGVP